MSAHTVGRSLKSSLDGGGVAVVVAVVRKVVVGVVPVVEVVVDISSALVIVIEVLVEEGFSFDVESISPHPPTNTNAKTSKNAKRRDFIQFTLSRKSVL